MKRIVGIVLFALICCASIQSSFAQSPDEIIKRFKKCEKADYQHFSSAMLGLVRMVMPSDASMFEDMTDEEMKKFLDDGKTTKEEFIQQCRVMIEFLKYTKSMTILSLDNCSVADKQNFIDTVKNWVPDGFESDKPEDGVFLKFKRETIHEVAVVNSSMDECSIMITKGELTPEFIKNVEQSMKSVFSAVE